MHGADCELMTVGELSRRTGRSVKAIREYEALGLIYSAGRSEGNYRLFDESALWCARVIVERRSVGVTIKEIQRLADTYSAIRISRSGRGSRRRSIAPSSGSTRSSTGPVGHALTLGAFLALYLTPRYARGLWVTSDAALIFFGASMLLAALRGYAGCEVLAVSNALLHRDDQVGCVLFAPVDHVERAGARKGPDKTPMPDDADAARRRPARRGRLRGDPHRGPRRPSASAH